MTLTPKELEIKERCELEALERLSDLRVIRKSKGIGLRQAARQIGISATYLAHIETGRVPLPKTNNEKFETFFGVRFPRSDEWQKGYNQAKTESESTISTLREEVELLKKAFGQAIVHGQLNIDEFGRVYAHHRNTAYYQGEQPDEELAEVLRKRSEAGQAEQTATQPASTNQEGVSPGAKQL